MPDEEKKEQEAPNTNKQESSEIKDAEPAKHTKDLGVNAEKNHEPLATDEVKKEADKADTKFPRPRTETGGKRDFSKPGGGRGRRSSRDSQKEPDKKPDRSTRSSRRTEESEEPSDGIIDTVVKINRCAKVVKGGRRFSFSALVVAGDTKGRVGVGLGKAPEVSSAVNKAVIIAKKEMVPVSLIGTTIPHETEGRYGSAIVRLLPASKGTGIIAGGPVRAVVVAAGIHDILTKTYGTNNPVNIVKATIEALKSLRTKNEVEKLRGVRL